MNLMLNELFYSHQSELKDLFTNLFAQLRETFKRPFILSAAISPDRCVNDIYDLKELEKFGQNLISSRLLTKVSFSQAFGFFQHFGLRATNWPILRTTQRTDDENQANHKRVDWY